MCGGPRTLSWPPLCLVPNQPLLITEYLPCLVLLFVVAVSCCKYVLVGLDHGEEGSVKEVLGLPDHFRRVLPHPGQPVGPVHRNHRRLVEALLSHSEKKWSQMFLGGKSKNRLTLKPDGCRTKLSIQTPQAFILNNAREKDRSFKSYQCPRTYTKCAVNIVSLWAKVDLSVIKKAQNIDPNVG